MILWATTVGLKKMLQIENRQRMEKREQTEKPITELPLITDGTAG